jgi:hypothetical protein
MSRTAEGLTKFQEKRIFMQMSRKDARVSSISANNPF